MIRVIEILIIAPVIICTPIHNFKDWRCGHRVLTTQTLAPCNYDNDCVEHAFCLNQQRCLCKEGYVADRNRTQVQCLKVAKVLGDSCTMDIQCQITFASHAVCRDNACQCSHGAHFKEGRCYESVGIGAMCQTHHNCYVKNSDSFCVSGFCSCPLLHHPSMDGTECLKSAFLLDPCKQDEECVPRNSRCFGTCQCKVDHVLSSDGKRCLKAANAVGDQCSEDSQCQEFLKHAACVNGKCSCVRHYHQRGSVCFRNVELRGSCQTHRQCITPRHIDSRSIEITKVDCLGGICTCAEGYMQTDDFEPDCIPYSENGCATTVSISTILQVIVVPLASFLLWR